MVRPCRTRRHVVSVDQEPSQEPSAQERIGSLAVELMEWMAEQHPDGELVSIAVSVAVEGPDKDEPDEEDSLWVHSLSEGDRLEHVGLLRLALSVIEHSHPT